MKKLTIISSMLLASGSAFANTEKVTAAITQGESLVQLTTGGVITVAAIG